MAGYTSIADLEIGSSVRSKINTQFTELFDENAKAKITVSDAAALAAIPPEYVTTGKIVRQYDAGTDYEWDGGAWVVSVPRGGQFFGECYLYANATAMAIDIANVYHACPNASQGLLNGFTYKGGKVSAVASVASAAGGSEITCTSNAHGFLDGEVITLTNSTDYDGVYLVKNKTVNTFDVAKAYVQSRSFNAVRGFSLRANAGTSGTFILDWNASAKNSSGTNKDWRIEANLNLVAQDKASSQIRIPSSTETSALAAGCILQLAAGDYVWISVKNITDTVDLVIIDANLRIRRI